MAMLRLLALAVVAAAIGATAASSQQWDQLSHGVSTSMSTFESAFRGHLKSQAMPMPDIDFTMPELSAVSVTCTAAITELQTVYTGTACSLLRTSLGLDISGSGVTQSAMTNWCTSDCLTNLKTKLDGVSASCSVSVDDRTIFSATAYATFVAQFRRAQFLTQGICVKNTANTKYCWPQISVMSTLAATGLSAATQTSVAAACDDECNSILVATVNTYGFKSLIATVRAASLYCMKVDGTYCTPLMANIGTAVATVDAAGRPTYTALCVPCISAWFRQVTVAIDSLEIDASVSVMIARAYSGMWNMLCLKAADGDYCYNKLLALSSAQDASFSAGITSCTGAVNSTCSANCKAAVVSLDTKLGCCLPATFYAIGGASVDGRSFISETCGVQLSDCSSKLVKGAIRVKNFLIAYYNANAAAVKAAIRADLALKLHLSVDQVTVTAVVDSTTNTTTSSSSMTTSSTTTTTSVGITASFTITPTTTSEATTISATFTALLNADSSMPATSDVGGEEAKSDPAASTSADVSATSTTVVTNPNADNAAAPAVAVSLGALLATVLAVVALL